MCLTTSVVERLESMTSNPVAWVDYRDAFVDRCGRKEFTTGSSQERWFKSYTTT